TAPLSAHGPDRTQTTQGRAPPSYCGNSRPGHCPTARRRSSTSCRFTEGAASALLPPAAWDTSTSPTSARARARLRLSSPSATSCAAGSGDAADVAEPAEPTEPAEPSPTASAALSLSARTGSTSRRGAAGFMVYTGAGTGTGVHDW